jgi:hypothetical protein
MGWGSGIRDPGVKKAPNPGSGSATFLFSFFVFIILSLFGTVILFFVLVLYGIGTVQVRYFRRKIKDKLIEMGQ